MKEPRIGPLRSTAEKDLRISHCARTLMFRIFSDRYLDPRNPAGEAFALTWRQVALWCGLQHKGNCYDRVDELVSGGYLYDEGVKGCPPRNFYKLNLKLDLTKLVKGGVIPPTVLRKGNKDAAARKGIAAMRAASR